MDSAGTVIFQRGDNNSDCGDIWDDTALIEAYDRAVSLAKDINEQRKKKSQSETHSECSSTARIPRSKNQRRRRKGSDRTIENTESLIWFPEDHCRAVYGADGCTYEAEIRSIDHDRSNCVVQFVGYGNEEEIMLNQLQPSSGEQARLVQFEQSQKIHTHTSKGAHPKQKRNAHPSTYQNAPQHQNGPKAEQQQQPFFMQGSPFASFGAHASIPPMVLPPPPLPFSGDVEEDDEALYSMLMSWYMSGYHTGYYQGLKCGRSRAASSSYHSPRGSRRQSPACSHKTTSRH